MFIITEFISIKFIQMIVHLPRLTILKKKNRISEKYKNDKKMCTLEVNS